MLTKELVAKGPHRICVMASVRDTTIILSSFQSESRDGLENPGKFTRTSRLAFKNKQD